MKYLVRVLLPFHSLALGKNLVSGDEVEFTDEQLASIRKVNINMVEVIGEVKPKKKAKTEE